MAYCFRSRLRNEELQKVNQFLKAENESLRNGDSPRSTSSGNMRRVNHLQISFFIFEIISLSYLLDWRIWSINITIRKNNCIDEKAYWCSSIRKSIPKIRSRSTKGNSKAAHFRSHSSSYSQKHFHLERFQPSLLYSGNWINQRNRKHGLCQLSRSLLFPFEFHWERTFSFVSAPKRNWPSSWTSGSITNESLTYVTQQWLSLKMHAI